jgi:hypothetical protein
MGSIPDVIGFFNWPNPSSWTMVLGLTQPLTEMSAMNLYWVRGQPACKADSLTAICEQIVYKMWAPQFLIVPWNSTTCYRESFTCFILFIYSLLHLKLTWTSHTHTHTHTHTHIYIYIYISYSVHLWPCTMYIYFQELPCWNYCLGICSIDGFLISSSFVAGNRSQLLRPPFLSVVSYISFDPQ